MSLFNFQKKNKTVLDENLSEQVQQVRELHKMALRQRLAKYHLTSEEIDKLFLIFTKAEEKIEKIQINMDYKKAKQIDLIEMQEKILTVQNKMKEEFEENLKKIIKNKYEFAKKIVQEIRENKQTT